MDNDLELKRVHEELQRRFWVAGRGAVSRVQEKLKRGSGYFRDLRRPGRRLDLRILLDALRELRVDPAEFFATVLGTMDPVSAFKAEAVALGRRQKRPPRILEFLDEREPGQRGEIFDLDQLSAEYRHQPKQVQRRAMAWICRIDDTQVSRLLGIYASACRNATQLELAQIVLVRALELAEERGAVSAQADLVQGCSYVLAARSDFHGAIALTERSILAHTRSGNTIGVGKALVDLAGWHGYLEQHEQGLEIYRAALEYLPADSERFDVRTTRCGCHINQGRISIRLRQFEQARRHVQRAREESAGMDAPLLGKAIWLEAQIARCEERYELAERLYGEAIDIYRGRDPLEASILTVGLVRVQLLQDKLGEAYATAKAMTALLFPLEHHPIAAAAITDLIRCALEGRGLTLPLLDHVARDLAKESKSPQAGSSL